MYEHSNDWQVTRWTCFCCPAFCIFQSEWVDERWIIKFQESKKFEVGNNCTSKPVYFQHAQVCTWSAFSNSMLFSDSLEVNPSLVSTGNAVPRSFLCSHNSRSSLDTAFSSFNSEAWSNPSHPAVPMSKDAHSSNVVSPKKVRTTLSQAATLPQTLHTLTLWSAFQKYILLIPWHSGTILNASYSSH